MSGAARPLAAALAGVALVAALLRSGPPIVGGWIGGMPAAAGESLFTLAIFGPMMLLGLIGRRLTMSGRLLASDRPGVAAWRGAVLGSGGLLLAVGYTWVAGVLTPGAGGAAGPVLMLGLLTVAVQVAGEEVLFRGWLQPSIAPILGTPAAIGLVAIVFAGLHVAGGVTGPLPLGNLCLGGVLFGLLAARDGGIAGAFAAHLCWNAGEQLILGLDPNPGTGAFGSLFDLDLIGAARWGGSDEGLNASVAMTIALAALVVPIVIRARSDPHHREPVSA